MRTIDQQIFGLALPAIVTNITVPLLGMADLAITGHMGNAAYIAAVALGSMTFNVIYWIFGFLRMGTGGLTAQALGANDRWQAQQVLRHSLTTALTIALVLVVGQRVVFDLTMLAMQPEPDVFEAVDTYFSICIWGAPAMMTLYSLTGWFIGMQTTRIPMYISIVQNIVNLLVSLSLVYLFGMHIEGVAIGTVVAQWAGALMAICMMIRLYQPSTNKKADSNQGSVLRFVIVNRDIFVRTLFLVAVNLYFTAAGSRQGTITLSANTLLMTLFTITSYVMDGFAYAAEAMGGKYCGAANRKQFDLLVRRLFFWGSIVALLFTIAFAGGGQGLISLLTTEQEVIDAAMPYMPWTVAIPFISVTTFMLDGLFVGITATRAMLWSTAVAATVFFAIYIGLSGVMGNHALWLALIAYLATRGLVEFIMLRRAATVFASFERNKSKIC